MELLRLWGSWAGGSGSAVGTTNNKYMHAYICMYLYSKQIDGLTCNFIAKESGDLVLAVFLLLVGQQLVNELPNHLFCWGIQHREDVHNQSVYISNGTEEKWIKSGFTQSSECSQRSIGDISILEYPFFLSLKYYGYVIHLCWKKASRALQMVYLSWSVRRCSSCWLKVRPCTRILGGKISATHWRELSTGPRERGETSTCSGSVMVKAGGPYSTTRLGIAPLPCSMDTTFSCEQLLRGCAKIQSIHRVDLSWAHTEQFLIVLHDCCLSDCTNKMIMSHCGILVVIVDSQDEFKNGCAQENMTRVLHYQPIHV